MTAADLGADLHAAADQITDTRQPHIDAGRAVLTRARPPKVSGRLDASLFADTRVGATTIGSDLVYAGPVHNGWPRRNITAQPFLYDAVDRDVDAIAQPFLDHAQRAVDTARGA